MPKRIVYFFAAIIPLSWCIPVAIGYLTSANSDRVFLGWIRSDDFHRYGSFIEQTVEFNRIIYEDYSTVEPQKPRMIVLYFTILGFIRKLTGIPGQHLWLLSGLVVGMGFICFVHQFLCAWIADRCERRLAFLLILFSSGMESFVNPVLNFVMNLASLPTGAWNLPIHIQLPRMKNFWMDGFSTFNSFHNPLKIAGIWLAMVLCHWLAQEESIRNRSRMAGIGCLILILWAVHPNSAIPAYAAMAATALIPVRTVGGLRSLLLKWRQMTPYCLPFLILGGYILWMKTDPMTANIIRQYQIPQSVEPYWTYPFRYGLLMVFGIWGIFHSLKTRSPIYVMMLGWLVSAEYFAHFAQMSGLLFQHMVHVPLAIFSAVSLADLIRHRRKLGYLLIGIIFLGSLINNIDTVCTVSKQTAADVWPTSLYMDRSEYELVKVLRELSPGNVLVNRDTGNKIGWLALHNVFLGHWGTTPDKGKKIQELETFYNPDSKTEFRLDLLRKYHIRYVWYGPHEQKLGPLPEDLPIIRIAGDSSAALYQVAWN